MGAPRSSAFAAATRESVHGARADAPAGGGTMTSANNPTRDGCHDVRIAASSPPRPASTARARAGASHTESHGNAAVRLAYAMLESARPMRSTPYARRVY